MSVLRFFKSLSTLPTPDETGIGPVATQETNLRVERTLERPEQAQDLYNLLVQAACWKQQINLWPRVRTIIVSKVSKRVKLLLGDTIHCGSPVVREPRLIPWREGKRYPQLQSEHHRKQWGERCGKWQDYQNSSGKDSSVTTWPNRQSHKVLVMVLNSKHKLMWWVTCYK